MTPSPTNTRDRATLRHGFTLPLTRRTAFRLFTARGERLWVPGWNPRFFTEVDDDLALGTVFGTTHDTGRPATWIVIDADPGIGVRYAVVVERFWAGTVTVALADCPEGCRVDVAYDLTATSPEGAARLHRFAGGYASFLAEWQSAILQHIAHDGRLPPPVESTV